MLAELPFGDKKITVEYELTPRVVVFSHGFGVLRDSRGLFSGITQALPKGVGYVLFDYNDVDAEKTTVRASGFSEQVQRLQTVLTWVRQQPGVEQVDLLGHSLGCLVIAELAPDNIGKLILLAPPTAQLGGFMRTRYIKRPGAVLKDGVWHIPRKDGTTTLISEEVLTEREQLDPEGELTKLAFFHPYTLIIAEADEVLQDDDYTELIVMDGVTALGIEGATHNFEGAARPEVIKTIVEQLA